MLPLPPLGPLSEKDGVSSPRPLPAALHATDSSALTANAETSPPGGADPGEENLVLDAAAAGLPVRSPARNGHTLLWSMALFGTGVLPGASWYWNSVFQLQREIDHLALLDFPGQQQLFALLAGTGTGAAAGLILGGAIHLLLALALRPNISSAGMVATSVIIGGGYIAGTARLFAELGMGVLHNFVLENPWSVTPDWKRFLPQAVVASAGGTLLAMWSYIRGRGHSSSIRSNSSRPAPPGTQSRKRWIVGLVLGNIALLFGAVVLVLPHFIASRDLPGWMRSLPGMPPPTPAEVAQARLSELGLNATPDSFLGAIPTSDVAMAILFVTAGVNPNQSGAAGESPLTIAAKGGRLEIVRYLVEQQGVDVATSLGGVSATDLAAKAGHEDVVEYLVSRGGVLTHDPQSVARWCGAVAERGNKVNELTFEGMRECGNSPGCMNQYMAARQKAYNSYRSYIAKNEAASEKYLKRKISDSDCCSIKPTQWRWRGGECTF